MLVEILGVDEYVEPSQLPYRPAPVVGERGVDQTALVVELDLAAPILPRGTPALKESREVYLTMRSYTGEITVAEPICIQATGQGQA
ncbi:MAG: hypothetical protein ACP5HD_10385 [Thermoproteus sp.]